MGRKMKTDPRNIENIHRETLFLSHSETAPFDEDIRRWTTRLAREEAEILRGFDDPRDHLKPEFR